MEIGAELEERAARMDDHLGAAVVVAQVDEEDAAVVALVVDPAGEADLLSGVFGTQFVASMGAIGMHGRGFRGTKRRLPRPP